VVLVQAVEQWLGEPRIDELFNTERFDLPGQIFVAFQTRRTLSGVFDACRAADQDETTDQFWKREGRIEAQSCTE
ncbi:MAG: hypothetical protein ACKOEH_07680, partial [Actinomycetota bacterium]